MSFDPQKIPAMREGGKALGAIREQLRAYVTVGMRFEEIENHAQALIAQAGMKPSFSTVPGYHWATCIMKNEEMCHGIPQGKVVEDGDVITIDVGLLNKGYHLDTTTTFVVGRTTPQISEFLAIGKKAVDKAIAKARVGASVYDVSHEMDSTLKKHGYGAIYQLTGHGIGKQLHMEPSIPVCAYKSDKRVILSEGQTLAIEVMYSMGKPDLILDTDGWTYKTKDESLTAMFEDTVLITKNGLETLTKS